MLVTHCLCLDLSFEELKAVADSRGLGFSELQTLTGCCTGCGTCEPYVRRMLATGETSIPLMCEAEMRRYSTPASG